MLNFSQYKTYAKDKKYKMGKRQKFAMMIPGGVIVLIIPPSGESPLNQ